MGRIALGWQLTKQSWAIVKGDRSLLLFPAVGAVCALVVGAVFFGVGAGVGAAADSGWAAAPFIVVGLYGLTVIGQFAAVALAACATASLDGRDTTFGEGVVGSASVGGIVFLVGILPGVAIAVLGAMLTGSAVAPGAVLIALGAAIVVLALVVQAALTSVFRVALYRYATQGAVPGSFTETQLQGAFRPKGRRRGLAT